MTKFGQVNAYNPKTGVASIVYTRPDACDKCGACGSKSHIGSIELYASCEIGNWVRVELPDGRFMKATALAYLLPLVSFLLGLFLGYFLSGKQEGWALGGSLLGLALSLLFLKLFEKRIAHKPEWSPRVMQVYLTKPEMGDIGCGGAGI